MLNMPYIYPLLYYNDNLNFIDLQVNVSVQSMAAQALCDENCITDAGRVKVSY